MAFQSLHSIIYELYFRHKRRVINFRHKRRVIDFRHKRRVIIPIPPREYQKRNTKY